MRISGRLIPFYKGGDARNSSLDPCHFELQVLSKLASTLPCSVAEIDRFKGRRKESSLSDRDGDSTSPPLLIRERKPL